MTLTWDSWTSATPPTEGQGTSPAQRLFGRRSKTLLPTAGRLLTQPEFDTTSQLLHAQKNKQASHYSNGTKELQPLESGSTIPIHPPKYRHQCTQATVDKQVSVGSYEVVTTEGCIAGTADTCLSQLKFQTNHLVTLRYLTPILVPCP